MDKQEQILQRLDKQDENFRLHALDDKRDFGARPTKEEMKQIVHDALVDYFATKGKISKNILVTTAIIFGSITVIVAGFKAILGVLGYAVFKQ